MSAILHIITSLETGGAEIMLLKLLEMGCGGAGQRVVTLRAGGALRPRLLATGVDLVELGLQGGYATPQAFLRLSRLIGRWQPSLIHGWMYHSNLAALLAQQLSGRVTPVLWNIRHSLHELGLEKRATRAVIRVGAPLSRFASAIVYNSRVSARQHEAIGYAGTRAEIIPNGFDTRRFHPDPAARASIRAELGLAPSTVAIGLIARYHLVKDHMTLLRAAGLVRGEGTDFALVMAGDGIDWRNTALTTAISAAGIGDRTRLLGERADVARILAGLDVLVLCSVSEGFPNVLGEAMACGVPCIATDVGDCRFLLGPAGIIVPPGDPAALAQALGRLCRMDPDLRREAGEIGRARVIQEFSLPFVAARYERLYDHIVDQASARNRERGGKRRFT